MLLRPNKTRTKLAAGDVAYGTITLIPEPSLAELLGAAGYDFIAIDMEHAAADGRTIENMIRAAEAVEITPLVRVRHVEEKTFLWVLDSGAQGIVIPMLEDAAMAREAYRLTRYPPDGDRTLCIVSRAAGRGAHRRNFTSFIEHVNREIMLVGLIETPEACANAAAMAKEGIDAFLIGRADLSMKMGYHYAPGHPNVIDATKRALGSVMDAGKAAAVLAYDVEDAIRWMEFGCRMIIYSEPEHLLAAHFSEALRAMKARDRASPRFIADAVIGAAAE